MEIRWHSYCPPDYWGEDLPRYCYCWIEFHNPPFMIIWRIDLCERADTELTIELLERGASKQIRQLTLEPMTTIPEISYGKLRLSDDETALLLGVTDFEELLHPDRELMMYILDTLEIYHKLGGAT